MGTRDSWFRRRTIPVAGMFRLNNRHASVQTVKFSMDVGVEETRRRVIAAVHEERPRAVAGPEAFSLPGKRNRFPVPGGRLWDREGHPLQPIPRPRSASHSRRGSRREEAACEAEGPRGPVPVAEKVPSSRSISYELGRSRKRSFLAPCGNKRIRLETMSDHELRPRQIRIGGGAPEPLEVLLQSNLILGMEDQAFCFHGRR